MLIASMVFAVFAGGDPAAVAQETVAQHSPIYDFRMSHINDMDALGADDLGHTFGGRITLNVFDQDDPSKADFRFQLGNDFYTDSRPDPKHPETEERNGIGNRFLNFSEEWNLNCEMRSWSEAPAQEGFRHRHYFAACVGVGYESTSPSLSGSETQEIFHRIVGVREEEGMLSNRLYDYSDNHLNRHRLNISTGVHGGTLIQWGKSLECDARAGATLCSTELGASSLDAEAKVRTMLTSTDLPPERARREPVVALYGRMSCSQFLDFEHRNTDLSVGMEAGIGLGGMRRFNCELEFIQPLEQNKDQHFGMLDDDLMVRMSFGVSW